MRVAVSERRLRVYRTDAVVLNRRDWGEADRLVTLFSPAYGKIRAVAPGARKPQTRKSGHLELFTRGHFVLARGRTFDKITQAETLDYFPNLRADLPSVGRAALVCELVDRFVEEGDENPPLYDLLVRTLGRLNANDAPDVALLFYLSRLLALVGYQPNLFRCAICGQLLRPADHFFSVEEGSVVCATCGDALPLHSVSLPVLKVLRFLQAEAWPRVRRLRLDTDTYRQTEGLLQAYVAYLLEREPRSVRFLREV